MRGEDVTREQAHAIKQKIRPMPAYLNRLKKRMNDRKTSSTWNTMNRGRLPDGKALRAVNRPLRCCQPRDLILQVRNYCRYANKPAKLTHETLDFAVANYFAVM